MVEKYSSILGEDIAGVVVEVGDADSASTWCVRYANINLKAFAPAIATKRPEVADKVWKEDVPEALADDSSKAVPPLLVVTKDLESLQMAMEREKEDVPARKVVVLLLPIREENKSTQG